MLLRSISVTLLAALAISPGAALASGDDVLIDCVNGTMKSHYPLADYDAALNEIPADASEYGPCREVITDARNRQLAAASTRTAAAARTVKPTALAAALGASAPDGAADALAKNEATASTAAQGTQPATATPVPPTTPTTPVATPEASSSAILIPVPGDDDPSSGTGAGLPLVPVILALSVIALSAARALHVWARRPERLAGEAADAA